MTNQSLKTAVTLEEIERLVQSLYRPGTDVYYIQSVLQGYQRSTEGWQLADALLQSQDPNVRFFGALTFTIKINNDWESLNPEGTEALRNRLMERLVLGSTVREVPLVLRKVCSTLVAYFLRPTVDWRRCVRHLMCCMDIKSVMSLESLSTMPPSHVLISRLDMLSIKTVLWFAMSLAEEAAKTDPNSIQTHGIHERLALDLETTTDIIQLLLTQTNLDIEVAEEAIKCSQAWITYARRAYIDKGFQPGMVRLRAIVPKILKSLTVEPLFEVVVEVLTDILTSFPAFLETAHFTSLATSLSDAAAQNWILALRSGEFDENAHDFSRLLFAYGDAAIQDLAQNPDLSQILHQLVQIVNCAGYDGATLQICSQAIEFWASFTEHAIDELFSDENSAPIWMDAAKRLVVSALEQGWAKIRYPSPDVVFAWDSETLTDFKALRRDLRDLIQASFTLLGMPIFETFAGLAVAAIDRQAWSDVEASLYCLNALSDAIRANSTDDDMLSKIFQSLLFDRANTPHLPIQTQQTALEFLENYTFFFELQHRYLPDILTYLFQCLDTPALANPAARAIFATCDSCGKQLLQEIGSFINAYGGLQEKDAKVKEKIIGAIAMVIREIPQSEAQINPLSELLYYVERDATVSGQQLAAGNFEEAFASGLCALSCLVSMGKALQSPDETIIDLEADLGAKSSHSNIWALEAGSGLQSRVMRLLQALTHSLHGNNDVIEAACQVLRTGYKEIELGLFVFPPNLTVELLEFGFRYRLDSPRMDYLLSAATTMLSRRRYATADAMNLASSNLLKLVLLYIQAGNSDPSDDPGTAAGCIELVNSIVLYYLDVFFQMQTANAFTELLIFSLRCLATSEIMPKRASASFWASLLQKRSTSAHVEHQLEAVLEEFGSQLSHILVRKIAGEAARSELDVLADPLKRLIANQAKAKQWLNDALASPAFPSQKVGDTEKRIWLQKVMNLRGARGTNQAVKDFWTACRGTSLAITS